MNDDAFAGGLIVLVVILALWASFSAPCGCYAGTPVRDVPARCTDIGSPTTR